jgi:hypothetical protein
LHLRGPSCFPSLFGQTTKQFGRDHGLLSWVLSRMQDHERLSGTSVSTLPSTPHTLLTMISLNTKAAKAERFSQPTQRASRHSLRRIYNSLTASVRSSPRQSDFLIEAEDHTRWLPQHPIAGDVYATHPELIESPHSRSASPANASHNGRGFLRHRRPSQVPVSRSPTSMTVASTPRSVIFISCPAR